MILNPFGDLTNDYINASHVDVSKKTLSQRHCVYPHFPILSLTQGYSKPKKFIAAQGKHRSLCGRNQLGLCVPRARPQYYSRLLEDGVAGESTISGDDHKPGGGEEDKV